MSQSWFELGMAQVLYDRGGFWQLKEYEECSFVPYRDVVREIVAEEKGHQELGEKIVKEEEGHQSLGERIVVDLVKTGAYEAVKQPMFDRWFRIGMLSFGRPASAGNRYAMSVGLKKRDSGDVMRDFVSDIRPAVRSSGLRFPDRASLQMELPPDIDWSV